MKLASVIRMYALPGLTDHRPWCPLRWFSDGFCCKHLLYYLASVPASIIRVKVAVAGNGRSTASIERNVSTSRRKH